MTQTEKTTLHSYSSSNRITLKNAVNSCQDCLEGAIALLYAPQRCQVAKLTENHFQTSNGQSIDAINPNFLGNIFEARIFNQNCELRWLNRLDGNGETVLLSESEQSLQGFSSHKSISCERLPQQYLLWGESTSTANAEGWQRLAEARIGKLDVPLDEALDDKKRAYLFSWEYLSAESDEFGNFSVIEERLVWE